MQAETASVLTRRQPLQDVGELFHIGVEARGQTIDVGGEAVVRHHRRNRGEQADGGGHQRFGDARRHGAQRRLAGVPQADEGMHDAPHGAEQADIGADRTHGRQEGGVAVQRIQLALRRRPHRAAGTVHDVGQLGAAAAAQFQKLGEAGLEDALHAHGVAAAAHILVQAVQVGTAPEIALELLAVALGRAQHRDLVEDQRPRQQGGQRQAGHHQLHQQAGVQDQADERNLLHVLFLSSYAA